MLTSHSVHSSYLMDNDCLILGLRAIWNSLPSHPAIPRRVTRPPSLQPDRLPAFL
jgi:hypothetical protein